MMYIGMQDQFFTFNMFDAQAWWARDVVLGRITIPSLDKMEEDDKKWAEREEKLGKQYNNNLQSLNITTNELIFSIYSKFER